MTKGQRSKVSPSAEATRRMGEWQNKVAKKTLKTPLNFALNNCPDFTSNSGRFIFFMLFFSILNQSTAAAQNKDLRYNNQGDFNPQEFDKLLTTSLSKNLTPSQSELIKEVAREMPLRDQKMMASCLTAALDHLVLKDGFINEVPKGATYHGGILFEQFAYDEDKNPEVVVKMPLKLRDEGGFTAKQIMHNTLPHESFHCVQLLEANKFKELLRDCFSTDRDEVTKCARVAYAEATVQLYEDDEKSTKMISKSLKEFDKIHKKINASLARHNKGGGVFAEDAKLLQRVGMASINNLDKCVITGGGNWAQQARKLMSQGHTAHDLSYSAGAQVLTGLLESDLPSVEKTAMETGGDKLRFIELVANYGELPDEVLEAIDPKIKEIVLSVKTLIFDRAIKSASNGAIETMASIFPDSKTKAKIDREL